MLKEKANAIYENIASWQAPAVTDDMPKGDMPGDKIAIGEDHIRKASKIFPKLIKLIADADSEKVVVSVFGGSGVGKSETASLLAHYLKAAGVGVYVLSGDNYPRRIPLYNDAERLSVFRSAGLKGVVSSGCYNDYVKEELSKLWVAETDADPKEAASREWLFSYQAAGRRALRGYLGTPAEQDYDEINAIIEAFKRGDKDIFLKRMGRTEDERWYDKVSFADTNVLIIEWTHGGNENLSGVDVPVLLNSTPEETREHRRLRARDGKTDSAFTTMVLEIEQEELDRVGKQAKIIMSKSGDFIDPATF
jgi:alpha-galactosidase